MSAENQMLQTTLQRATTAVVAFLVLSTLAFGVHAVEPIRVAAINGYSGPNGFVGDEQAKTLEAAFEAVNSRGGVLGGRKFEVVRFDNKGSPQESLIVLERAIAQDFHIVVSSISSVAHAINDAVSKHNARTPEKPVLFIDLSALDPALTESRCSFWHFRFEPHADTQLSVLTDYMVRQASVRNIYLLNQDYSYGQGVSKSSREMIAAKMPSANIVGDDLVPLGKVKDFAPYVAKIRAVHADTVLTGNWGQDLALYIKASNETRSEVMNYTLLGAFFGTSAAIGAAGADRVRSITSWHINAAGPAWQSVLLEQRRRHAALSNMAWLPSIRVAEMLAAAIAKAGSEDTVRIAYALEGLTYTGPSGPSWMRTEDHQIIAPIFVVRFAKAGAIGIRYDDENTGYGWRTEALVEAKDAVPPLACRMSRPPRR